MGCVYGDINALSNAEIRIEDGWSLNNVINMNTSFMNTNIRGTAYIGKNTRSAYQTYSNCRNINKIHWNTGKIIGITNTATLCNYTETFFNCINVESIYYDSPISIQSWFGHAFRSTGVRNTVSVANFPFYNKLKTIEIGPNVTNLYRTFRGYAYISAWNANANNSQGAWEALGVYVNNRFGGNPRIIGGNNVIDMSYAFAYQNTWSEVICGDKVVNAYYAYGLGANAPIAKPVVGNSLVDARYMYHYCYGMGRNMNDNDIIPLRPSIAMTSYMYNGCSNMHGTIDKENFLKMNVGNNHCNYMFANCVNISNNSVFIVPQGIPNSFKVAYMYANLHNKGIKELYIAGMPRPQGDNIQNGIMEDMFGTAANASFAGNNIKNLYVLNTFGTVAPFVYSTLTYLNGLENAYINCYNAYGVFITGTDSANKNLARSNNFNKLKHVEFQNGVWSVNTAMNSLATNSIQNLILSDSIVWATNFTSDYALGNGMS